jgi:hypothetical protein
MNPRTSMEIFILFDMVSSVVHVKVNEGTRQFPKGFVPAQ